MGVLINSIKILFFIIFLTVIFINYFAFPVLATISLNVSASLTTQLNKNITIKGSIVNTTTSDTIAGINVTAVVNGSGASQTTGADGTFRFNITAPNTPGEKFVTITTNSSSLRTETIPIFATNLTSGSISYVGNFPPFTNGSNMTINITLFNGTIPFANYFPNVSIYKSNGGRISWGIYNYSASTGTGGFITFNVTIPASAEIGQYAIVVERGALFTIFEIRSNYMMAVSTMSTADERTSNFAPSGTVNVLAKVRTTTGNPTSATGISALITLPNGTVRNISLSVHPTLTGQYNKTFTETSASGQYQVAIYAVVAGAQLQANTVFSTKVFEVDLEMQKKFFMEWGGQAAFKAGGVVALDIVPINMTDDTTINVGGAVWPACNTTYLKMVDVTYPNGTSINSSQPIVGVSFSTSQSLTDSVCKINFTAPAVTGAYGLKVNVTVAGVTEQAEGFFAVQKIFLKVSPVSGLGGQEDFMSVVSPGENVTLDMTAYNLTTEAQIDGTSISNIVAKRIVPLEFATGSSELTTLNQSATTGSNPQILVQIPSSVMGPAIVEIEASVGTEKVIGTAFFISNYLSGFLFPASGMGGEGGGDFGGAPFASCSGTLSFRGNVNEVKTGTAAQGVSVVSIIQAREELTGRDVSGMLSIAGTTASDSNGQITINVTFSPSSGYGFSGFYFMIFNASYKGNSAGLPAGFMCKQLDFWPTIQAIGTTQESWRVSPTSGVNVTISNVARLNDSAIITNRSYLTLPTVFNFNPSKGGMKVLIPQNISALNATFVQRGNNYTAVDSNYVSLAIYPQNFTSGGQALTEWPNGFLDLQPRITSVDIDGASDTGFGGFQVVGFDAWIEGWDWGAKGAGQTLSYVVDVRANVSKNVTNAAGENGIVPDTVFVRTSASNNMTGFTVRIGRPWEGEMTTLTAVNATLLSDGWNHSSNTSFERWNVTFVIPQTTKKGEAQLVITVNNSNGQETDIDLWFTITKYTVILPSEEGLGSQPSSPFDAYYIPMVDNGQCSGGCGGNTSAYGWNMTYINYTYGITSRSTGWNPSWAGKVCVKNQFNVTRYVQANQLAITINSSVRVAVVDNRTAGVYDTVILNNTEGNITILNTTDINSRKYGSSALYLWSIEDCGYVKFVNASSGALPSSGNWGGSHQANTNFTIPYVITLANTPQASVNVSIRSIGKQDDRGFGFEGKMTVGDTPRGNYTSVPVNATTDTNGIAFVGVNVSASGRLVAFWKIDTTAGDTDIATMSSATFFESKAFSTNGYSVFDLPMRYVNLTYVANSGGGYLGAFAAASEPWVYAANVTETNANDFVRDGTAATYYIVYAPNRNATKTSTSTDLSGSAADYLNATTSIGGTSLAVAWMHPNSSATGSLQFVFFQTSPQGNRPTTVTTGTENITVAVCGEGYEKPNARPKEGAAVRLTVTDWSAFPPSTKNLQMYEMQNHTAIALGSSAVTGPKGCALLNVGPGQLSTWPSASAGKPPVFIEGTVTSGSLVESVYVTDVFRI